MSDREVINKWKSLHDNPEERITLPPDILDSWERCYSYGVNRYLRKVPRICTQTELKVYQDEAEPVITLSRSVIEDLCNFLVGTGFVVTLANANLCTVKVYGDAKGLDWADEALLQEGAMWEEKIAGTNAGSLAMVLGKPVSVFGYEHFCLFSTVAASTCAPIIDQGKICGYLSMNAPYSQVNSHTLGMVIASAKHIKYKLAVNRLQSYFTLVMDSFQDGLFAFNSDGIVQYMNENCAQALKLKKESALGYSIFDLFGHESKNHYFLSKITSGSSITDEYISITIGGETLHFYISCNHLNSPYSEDGAVVVVREGQRLKRLVRNTIGGGAKMTFDDIVGSSPELLHCLETARSAAPSLSNILLSGESGVGKDIIAQAMHNACPRKHNPYLALNCAALPRDLIASELFGYEEGAFTGARRGGNMGKFELADQGTLFLDEIGDMPLDIQATLLRVIEEKTIMRLGGTTQIPVNVRIIAATNQDLEAMVANKTFRRDLYYRLAIIRINIPPLRNRPTDIPLLAQHFLNRICERYNRPTMTFAPEVIETFLNYSWPGNIREMQNFIEGAVQLTSGNIISYDYILVNDYFRKHNIILTNHTISPSNELADNDNGITDEESEKLKILECLQEYRFNKSKVASALGWSRRTLYNRLEKYNIPK